MTDGTAKRQCKICGGPVRRDSIAGICRRTPECVTARRKLYRVPQRQPGQTECACPGCPNELLPGSSLCRMHHQRYRKAGDYGEAQPRKSATVVNAGDVFGAWTALEDYGRSDQRVLCRCLCGIEKRTQAKALVDGNSRSCGCRIGRAAGRAGILKAGERYGSLTVLEEATFGNELILCRCDCGAELARVATQVRRGAVKTCGCGLGSGMRTHGLSRHPLYGVWRGMIGRCTDPRYRAYENYGGRGITVCERWLGTPDGFLNFVADMGPRPAGLSIDRTDNDSGYSPDNCTWATKKQQTSNRRSVTSLTRERDALAERVRELEALVAELQAA